MTCSVCSYSCWWCWGHYWCSAGLFQQVNWSSCCPHQHDNCPGYDSPNPHIPSPLSNCWIGWCYS